MESPADGRLVVSPAVDVGEGIAKVNKKGAWIRVELAFGSGSVGDDKAVGGGGTIGSVATVNMSRSEGICADIEEAVGVSWPI